MFADMFACVCRPCWWRPALLRRAGELPQSYKLPKDVSQNYTCIAFDAGGTTGWAVIVVKGLAMLEPAERIGDNILFWNAGEFTGDEDWQVDQMVRLVDAYPDDADVVNEDFILRAYRRDRALLAPVRINAAFKYALRWVGRRKHGAPALKNGYANPRRFFLQQPALAMTTVPDSRLADFGFLKPLTAQPHARDAMRHALTFARRRKNALEKGIDVIGEV